MAGFNFSSPEKRTLAPLNGLILHHQSLEMFVEILEILLISYTVSHVLHSKPVRRSLEIYFGRSSLASL